MGLQYIYIKPTYTDRHMTNNAMTRVIGSHGVTRVITMTRVIVWWVIYIDTQLYILSRYVVKCHLCMLFQICDLEKSIDELQAKVVASQVQVPLGAEAIHRAQKDSYILQRELQKEKAAHAELREKYVSL